MTEAPVADDTPLRKARGAFFTPAPIAEFITAWAIRSAADRVLDPSCGDAAFLVPAIERLRSLGAARPSAEGVEIDGPTAYEARNRVAAAGGTAGIRVSDFFDVEPVRECEAVIGNPPYIRYQGFKGPMRAAARLAALRAGVSISALASSWAPFVIHASQFLVPGGRLGFVLPAELLSVNYAAPVRRFLFENFGSLELVLFERQVFAQAEADVVLLLAEGFGSSTGTATIRQVPGERDLVSPDAGLRWRPADPGGKWTTVLVPAAAAEVSARLIDSGGFARLDSWGSTRLGTVTGNNRYFTLSPARAGELGLGGRDLVPVSPAGSAHLRGLELSGERFLSLGAQGESTWLFRPDEPLSRAAAAYVRIGHDAGVDQAYKCRVRTPWYRVPLLDAPDLFLTCMNADTPRLAANAAGVHHLNSVHGVYLDERVRLLGRELLPLASLNSVTLLSAEMSGRSYGGGILKLEPGEAASWAMPSCGLVADRADALRAIRSEVSHALAKGELLGAVHLVDGILLSDSGMLTDAELATVRDAWSSMSARRARRGRRHG